MGHILLAGYEDAPSFLNQWNLLRIYAYIAKDLLSENSCARNMCHILLAGYEDVPSFLNQWKLIERPYMIKRNMFY